MRNLLRGVSGSAASSARIMSSTPRPGSTVSSFAASSPARWRASRLGRAVPTRICSTLPSTRWKARSSRRAPTALAFQMRRQLGGEMLDGAGEIGRLGDRLGEAEPHPPHRRLAHRRQRLRNRAERLIETPRHTLAETAGERLARHRIEIADPAQPDPAQPGDGCRVEPQRLDRQRRQRGALLAGAGQRRPAGLRREPRQRRCRAQRTGDRDPVRDALPREAARQIGRELVLAAPQMGAAGNLDLDAVARRRERSTGCSGRTIRRAGSAPRRRPPARPARSAGPARTTARRRAASPAPTRPPPRPG